MGMFDYVNFKMPCPQCGEEVGNWQTKSTDCTMDTVDPQACSSFYSRCEKCKLWFDFGREIPVTPPRSTPYTLDEVRAMGFSMTTRSTDYPRIYERLSGDSQPVAEHKK